MNYRYLIQRIFIFIAFLFIFPLIFKINMFHITLALRYDNVTLIPLVLQLGLRIGPIQRMGANWKFSLSEYFDFLFAYLVITYYSLQFLSNGDTK